MTITDDAPAVAPATDPSPDGDIGRPASTRLFGAAMDALDGLRRQAIEEAWPDRITSDEHACAMAVAASLRADCTRRWVGVIVFSEHGRVIGAGRNGAPAGYPGCLSSGACPRGQQSTTEVAPGSSYTGGAGLCIALHAEDNGIAWSDPQARYGGSMAISDPPCDQCAIRLAGSGLARAIWPERNANGLWIVREIGLGFPHAIGGHYS